METNENAIQEGVNTPVVSGSFERASRIAFVDISEYLKENYDNIVVNLENNEKEVWVVTPELINSKLSRRLNKELGINKINYYGNKNRTR